MPGKHNAGGCGCCDECSSCSTARDYLIGLYGYTGIDISGGPNIGTLETLALHSYLTFTHLEDTTQGAGGAYVPYDTAYASSDFSGTMSDSIDTGSCSTPLADFLCSTEPYKMAGVFEFEEYAQSGGNDRFRARVLRTEGYESTTACFYSGSLYLPQPFYLAGGIAWSCVGGAATYKLTITATVKFALIDRGGSNPTGFYYPPGSSSEWTFSGGLYTKNGTTSSEGAVIAWSDGAGLYGGDTLTTLEATSWTSFPNTSVSLWQPTDVIDVTGYCIGTLNLT